MIENAGRAVPANVTRSVAEVLREPLPASRYDAIVSITVLHHMPVEEALPHWPQRCAQAESWPPSLCPGVICSSGPPNSRRRPAGLLALLAALAEAGRDPNGLGTQREPGTRPMSQITR